MAKLICAAREAADARSWPLEVGVGMAPTGAADAGRNVTDWLDVLPKWLRFLSTQNMTTSDDVRQQQPLLLLGLISGDADRRELLRCTWVRSLSASDVTLRFVVGNGARDERMADVLSVAVDEHRLLRTTSNKSGIKRAVFASKSSTYSTYSSYVKLVHFLKFAASRAEPAIGIGDDDVFIQPKMLVAYLRLLTGRYANDAVAPRAPAIEDDARAAADAARLPSHVNRWVPRHHSGGLQGEWYAGLFEWYSWVPETMQATGFARSMLGALFTAHPRNCSPNGRGWINGTSVEAPLRKHPTGGCTGPFAFVRSAVILAACPLLDALVAGMRPKIHSETANPVARRPKGRWLYLAPQLFAG